MNILFVPTKDPRLRNGGNEQRTNLLWEALKKSGNVYTFLPDHKLERCGCMIDGKYPIYKFAIRNKNKYTIWYILHWLCSNITGFSIYRNRITDNIDPREIFSGVKFDIVVVRYLYLSCHQNFWKIAPTYVDIDDHPIQVYETTRRKHLPIALRKIGDFLIRVQTATIIQKTQGGWIANAEQVKMCGENYHFLPNIPNTPSENYNRNKKKRNGLLTIGNMAYAPNYNGVSKFLNDVWPSFHEKYPEVEYIIGGMNAPENLVKQWNCINGVKYVGFIDDVEGAYQNCLATVVPVDSGGGTCIKTLESMSFYRTCLSTPFGARGLNDYVSKGEGCLHVYRNASDFMEAFKNLTNVEKRDREENESHKFICQNYSSSSFNEIVFNTISICPK